MVVKSLFAGRQARRMLMLKRLKLPNGFQAMVFGVFFLFYFIFKLYNIVLVLPNIEMNPPQGRGFRMGNTGYGF